MSAYTPMKQVTNEEYRKFIKAHRYVLIEDQKVPLLGDNWKITEYSPKNYNPEKETVWSFLDRGSWATHSGNYRGNWSPFIPHNLITRFTKPREWVLDQMVGSGTTLVECKLLGRNAIGVDVNLNAIMVARDRLNFSYTVPAVDYEKPVIRTYVGDARNLNDIPDESIDLVATHPPYASIVRYSRRNVEGDLSTIRKLEDYLVEMRKVAEECFRVLKPNKHCGVLIGDTRKYKHYIPIAFRVLQEFLNVGFLLREDIIKLQWKTRATRERWRSSTLDFYRIAHEHLFLFRKPLDEKEEDKFRLSGKRW